MARSQFSTLKADLKVRLYDLKVRLHDLKVRPYDLKVRLYDLKVRLYDLKVRLHDLKVRRYDLKARRYDRLFRLTLAVAVLLVAAALPASAQPATAARAGLPRMWDGKPDLNGVWQALSTADFDLQDHGARLGVPAGQGVVEGNDIPYQPWALAKKQENFRNRTTADPEEKCFLLGVPRTMYAPFPFQITHSPGYIAVFSEYAHTTRSIFMNSEHPPGPIEWFMGDSRGRWEGDTLVVDVKYFTDQTWLDRAGNFHSEDLHVVERYTMTTPDHIQYEATLEDPKVFTRPWKISLVLYRRKEQNVRVLEYECYAYAEEEAARRGELGPK